MVGIVIFVLELRAIRKNLKLQNFDAHIHDEQIVFQSGTNSNYLVVLIQTEACQWVCLWWLLLWPVKKLKCYISTDEMDSGVGLRVEAITSMNGLGTKKLYT